MIRGGWVLRVISLRLLSTRVYNLSHVIFYLNTVTRAHKIVGFFSALETDHHNCMAASWYCLWRFTASNDLANLLPTF